MPIVILRNDDRSQIWKDALKTIDPSLEVYCHTETHPRNRIQMAAVWKHPKESLRAYPNLRAVQGLGAGVDFILEDPHLPPDLPVMRIVDPNLAGDMAEYVLTQCLAHLKGLPGYYADQREGRWNPKPYRRAGEVRVGIMGLGQLGLQVADSLRRNGFACCGWTRTSRPEVPFPVYRGAEEQKAFLAFSEILVCLLPLTPQTESILNKDVFDLLPQGAYLINVARGGLLNEADLMAALDINSLSGACLDVFRKEPLPVAHPFWSDPRINITPHMASVSDPHSVAAQVVFNYHALLEGRKPKNLVSKDRGY
jgi:glyoxylate/hydroxypyruvate reductase A